MATPKKPFFLPTVKYGVKQLQWDSAAHSPPRRPRDKTDVVELILRRILPCDLPVASVVLRLYHETSDALQAEQ